MIKKDRMRFSQNWKSPPRIGGHKPKDANCQNAVSSMAGKDIDVKISVESVPILFNQDICDGTLGFQLALAGQHDPVKSSRDARANVACELPNLVDRHRLL